MASSSSSSSPAEAERGHVGYLGAAAVLIDGAEVAVEVDLRGHFQPIDGFFHWYGRVKANPELDRLVTGNRAEVVLRTPRGESPAELADPDLWDRYRISGVSTPPFALDLQVDPE
jgi:hypothetical protein